MKKLLLIAFLFPFMVSGQILRYSDPLNQSDKLFAGDKIDHVAWSCVGTGIISAALQELKVKNPEVTGVAIILGCGFAKEFLYDKRPSPNDLIANFTGAIIGYHLAKWSNKQYAKTKQSKPIITNAIH